MDFYKSETYRRQETCSSVRRPDLTLLDNKQLSVSQWDITAARLPVNVSSFSQQSTTSLFDLIYFRDFRFHFSIRACNSTQPFALLYIGRLSLFLDLFLFSPRQHYMQYVLYAIARPSTLISSIVSYRIVSVCLSVTRVDQSKTVEVRIMLFSPLSTKYLISELVYFVCGLSPPKCRVIRRRDFACRRVPTICRTCAGFYVYRGRRYENNDIFQFCFSTFLLPIPPGWLAAR